MSKLFISLLLLLFTFTLSSKLQTKCISKDGDCDSTSYCCSDLVCKDYRCTLKGCKGKAIYNMKFRKFTIVSEHTKPYEEHYCSNPIDEKTKNWIIYLKNNEILSDLQIILI